MLATPHLGASTAEAQLKVAQEVAQQFVAAVKGEGLMGVVCCYNHTSLPIIEYCIKKQSMQDISYKFSLVKLHFSDWKLIFLFLFF